MRMSLNLRTRSADLFAHVPPVGGPEWDAWVARSAELTSAVNAAWALVAPPTHWKDAVDATVPNEALHALGATVDDLMVAVEFITATTPTVTPLPDLDSVRVTAAGYRAGPAGDH